MPTASSGPFDFAISGKHSLFFRKSVNLPRPKATTPTSASAGVTMTVSLSTKKIKGLHENDFIMASKIDRVLDRSGQSLDR